MDILFTRDQEQSSVYRIKFKLWSKIELDEEEQELVERYRFDEAMLIAVYEPELMRKAVIVGIVAWLLGTGFFTAMTTMFVGAFLGVAAGIGGAWWYYNEKRETVYVKDRDPRQIF